MRPPAGFATSRSPWRAPSARVKAPVKPAPFHALRAFATVRPTMFGTVWQAGVGVGVGAGVGVGGGVGAGVGVGGGVGSWRGGSRSCGVAVGAGVAPSGTGVAPGCSVGVAAGREVGAGCAGRLAGGVGRRRLVRRRGDRTAPGIRGFVRGRLRGDAGGRSGGRVGRIQDALHAPGLERVSEDQGEHGDKRGPRHRCQPARAGSAGGERPGESLPRRPARPCASEGWRPRPRPSRPRASRRRPRALRQQGTRPPASWRRGPRPRGRASATAATGATAAAAATSGAYLVPHSGQASAASSQHQRQANTSQAGQWQRPTHGPIAATSTDVPQRSQKGSGASPGSRAPCLAGLRAASFRGLHHIRQGSMAG